MRHWQEQQLTATNGKVVQSDDASAERTFVHPMKSESIESVEHACNEAAVVE